MPLVPSAFSAPDTANPGRICFFDATITNGTSLSGVIDLGSMTLCGVLISAAWTAAGLSFQGSPDGVIYGKLIDASGTEITAASIAGGEYLSLDPHKFFGTRFLKLRSGTNGTPVNQGADRVLRVAARLKD
jgi:hypothetical protein